MEDNNKQEPEFSEEQGNLSIVKKEGSPLVKSEDDAVIVDRSGLDVKKGGNIVIGTLNVFTDKMKARHEKHYRGNYAHLIMDIALALTVLTLLIFTVWLVIAQPWKKDLLLEVKAESSSVSNFKLENFDITYHNNSDYQLQNVELALLLPSNFQIKSVEPASLFDSQNNLFKLGELSSGANGKVIVSGIFLDNFDAPEKISAIATYKKSMLTLHNSQTLNLTIDHSALGETINLPAVVYKGAEFTATATVKNNGDINFDQVDIGDKDSGWQIKNANCSTGCSVEGNALVIKDLAAGESREVTLALIANQSAGSQEFDFNNFVIVKGGRYRQAEISRTVEVKIPNFQLSVSPEQKFSSASGQAIYKLTFQNNETIDVSNISLKFSSGNKNFTVKSLNISKKPDGFSSVNNLLTAQNIASGESGEIDLVVNYARSVFVPNQEFYLQIDLTYRIDGQDVKYFITSDKIKILSDLKIKSGAYYYSPQGDQLGIGPLPPLVGIPTRYWIIWEVNNRGNDLNNFQISAQLPANVSWTGNTSLLAGNLKYDDVSRQVTWQITQIVADSAISKVGFEVQVIPESTDTGKILSLLSNLSYKTTDAFCQKEISGNLKNLTSDLEYDALAKGKNKVVGE